MLSASEGSIYGRFGFSPATYRTRWELARHEAALLPAEPDPGSLELVDAAQAKKAWPRVHADVRARRVGELSPLPGRWEGLSDEADGTNGPLRFLAHRDQHGDVDGIANFRLPWSPTADRAGTLVVEALEATNPVAYRAMWGLLSDFVPHQDRRGAWPSARRTPAVDAHEPASDAHHPPDGQPLGASSRRPPSPGATLVPHARQADIHHPIDDDQMCPANNGTWHLKADDPVVTCVPTDEAADLTITLSALSSLYFGGMSAHHLAHAGHITPHTDGAIGQLARMFRTGGLQPNASGPVAAGSP